MLMTVERCRNPVERSGRHDGILGEHLSPVAKCLVAREHVKSSAKRSVAMTPIPRYPLR